MTKSLELRQNSRIYKSDGFIESKVDKIEWMNFQ